MCPYEPNVDRVEVEVDPNNQSEFITSDVKNVTPILENAGIAVFFFHLSGSGPTRGFRFCVPSLEGLLTTRVGSPILDQCFAGDDPHELSAVPFAESISKFPLWELCILGLDSLGSKFRILYP